MRKSVISLLLSISMIVGSIGAVPAFAAEAVEEETASSTGSAEEVIEEAADTASSAAGTDTASDEAGTSSTLVTSEAAKEIEEVSDAATKSCFGKHVQGGRQNDSARGRRNNAAVPDEP